MAHKRILFLATILLFAMSSNIEFLTGLDDGFFQKFVLVGYPGFQKAGN